MIRSLKKLLSYTVEETNGNKGKVKDFLFDEEDKRVRYLEIDMGNIFSGEKVLVSESLLKSPNWESKHFPIELTMEQLEKCPKLDEHLPVSREYEKILNDYYGTPGYWDYAYIPPKAQHFWDDKAVIEKKIHTHLRSFEEVMNYRIHAENGIIGHCRDLLVEDVNWNIKYLIASIQKNSLTENYKVMLSLDWIDKIDYAEKEIHMNVTEESIKNSPEFNPSELVNEVYEKKLYDYYGRS